jgi:carbon dioxide concentrating mechanism protein CcmM
MQDGVVIHGLETTKDGKNLDKKRFTNDGELSLGNDTRFKEGYSVFVGERTSLAHGALVHDPAYIGYDRFVRMESLVFNAKIGNNVAIGVSSTITGGVEVPDNKYVPSGSVITTQEQVDNLHSRIESTYENINGE